MKWIVTAAMVAAFSGLLLQGEAARAQTAASGAPTAQASNPAITDASAQRRRPLRRVPICRPDREPDVYPRYNPGPNAVRDCTATYVPEYRPSGTVITPRMNCYWRPGLNAFHTTPAHGAVQAGANHHRHHPIDDDGHHRLREMACGSPPPPRALRGERGAVRD